MRAGTRVPWLCAWVARRPSSAVWTEDKLALPLRRDEALVALACPRTSTRPSLARGLSRARLSLSCAHAPASTRPADSPPSRSSSRPSPSAFALTRFVSLSLLRSLAGARSPGAARLASYTLSRAKRAETRRPQRATPTDPSSSPRAQHHDVDVGPYEHNFVNDEPLDSVIKWHIACVDFLQLSHLGVPPLTRPLLPLTQHPGLLLGHPLPCRCVTFPLHGCTTPGS